ncbi:ricin-type beta-trefoil lectin domain protein [Planosporangium sp. 12N6]|uniref:ricin-type beta-trefoil lectin domain protein n=1 Tax=Planosporangium spinosum TaxID=3402278 RepID=UPI003CF3F689
MFAAAATGVALVAGAFLGAPVASAAPTAPALGAGTEVADAPPTLLSAMQRDLHLDAAQARTRLSVERAARTAEVALRARLGTGYAGAWLTPDSRLVVGVTDQRQASLVRSMGAEPKLVRYSERDLDGARTQLDHQAARAGRGVHSWYVDPTSNSVVVTADSTAAANAFVAAAGVDRGAVRTQADPAAAPRPLADIRGGDEYITNGNALCSVGFSVVGGFVTAGHCGGAGSPTAGSNWAAQGTVRDSVFPGNDYAWVQVNSGWTPQPWVNNYSGGVVGVAGSQEAGIGASVCRSGRTTGWRCGTIQAKNVTVNYAQGPVYGLTQSNACAEGGDSGGSWISGDQAQGTTSGGSGNCSTGGTTFFQPVNATLARFGLSLVTTGGGSASRIIGYANKCIDVPNSNSVDGQYLQLWECNNTAAQNWTFAGDGTVRAFGKCMDVAWGSRDNGAVIQLANCSGNPAQQFVLSAAGDLVNPQSNKCVDVKDWDSNNGARLIQWECTGGANQKWRRG